MLPMRKPVIVKSPEGEMKGNRICPRVSLDIKGVNFEANLIVLELVDIDVILGIGWLSACKGVIKYAQHSVLLTTPSGERIEYEGIQPVPEDNVGLITTHGAKEVVYGLIAVSSDTAMVLFDLIASHSFISREYVEEHKITMLPMRKPLILNSRGGQIKADRICPKVSRDIKGVNFVINLIVLELMEIDVILGKGWFLLVKE